jgi:MATE family multidrug resistance protein
MFLIFEPERTRSVLNLAAPVMVGMVSVTLLSVVDTAMVGRLGAPALAASGLGGQMFWLVMGSLGALSVGTQAISARRVGESRHDAAGQVIDNATVIAVVIGTVMTAVGVLLTPVLFPLIIHDPKVAVLGVGYLEARFWGALPFMVMWGFRGFYNGIGKTVVPMRVAIMVNAVNIFLNWVLIYGNLGFPKFGVVGAGMASSIATAIGAIAMVSTAYYGGYRSQYDLFRKGNSSMEIKKAIMKLAIPTTMQNALAMTGYAVFLAMIGLIGTEQQAVSNVIFTIMSISFLPGVSFGVAASTLISQKLGEGTAKAAESMGWESMKLSATLMGMLGIIFMLFPSDLIEIFTNDPTLVKMGVVSLRIMGAVQAFDGIGMTMSSALQGAGMNRWVMIAEVCISWGLFIPLTYLMGIKAGWGIVGAWSAVAVNLVLFAAACSLKFAGRKWQAVRI